MKYAFIYINLSFWKEKENSIQKWMAKQSEASFGKTRTECKKVGRREKSPKIAELLEGRTAGEFLKANIFFLFYYKRMSSTYISINQCRMTEFVSTFLPGDTRRHTASDRDDWQWTGEKFIAYVGTQSAAESEAPKDGK